VFISSSTSAYQAIGRLEVTLRRVIRWELRGVHGRQWLISLEDFLDRIEQNRQRENGKGFVDHAASELSYLSLSDLFHIVDKARFGVRGVLNGHKFSESERSQIAFLRNRVAHFRVVAASDLKRVDTVDWVYQELASYFSSPKTRSFVIDSRDSDQNLNDSFLLASELTALGFDGLLDYFSSVEQTGLHGFVTKLGVFGHHLYLEAYTESGYFDPTKVQRWGLQVSDRVTFLRFGSACQYVRLFVSSRLDLNDVKKIVRAAINICRESIEVDASAPQLELSRLKETLSDYLIVEGSGAEIGFCL
jgi:hypothetical protein